MFLCSEMILGKYKMQKHYNHWRTFHPSASPSHNQRENEEIWKPQTPNHYTLVASCPWVAHIWRLPFCFHIIINKIKVHSYINIITKVWLKVTKSLRHTIATYLTSWRCCDLRNPKIARYICLYIPSFGSMFFENCQLGT